MGKSPWCAAAISRAANRRVPAPQQERASSVSDFVAVRPSKAFSEYPGPLTNPKPSPVGSACFAKESSSVCKFSFALSSNSPSTSASPNFLPSLARSVLSDSRRSSADPCMSRRSLSFRSSPQRRISPMFLRRATGKWSASLFG